MSELIWPEHWFFMRIQCAAATGLILISTCDIRMLYWISRRTLAGIAGLLNIAISMALQLMRLG